MRPELDHSMTDKEIDGIPAAVKQVGIAGRSKGQIDAVSVCLVGSFGELNLFLDPESVKYLYECLHDMAARFPGAIPS